MNWSRTKSIFIVAFLILNSFLGYQLWEKMQTKQLELAQLSESSLEELLALRNIMIDTELQAEQFELPQLNAQFLINTFEDLEKMERQRIFFQGHVIHSQLIDPVELSPEVKTEELQQILDTYVVWGEQYKYDYHTEDSIYFLQQVEGKPIFVGGLKLLLNPEERSQVLGYEQVFYQVINTGTKQPVISSYTAIRTLLDNQTIPYFSTIIGAELGYYGQVYEVDSQVLTPAWRIVMETEGKYKIVYVNGITGAIEIEYIR